MIYAATILLTGGRAPATLHLARLLKQQHCRVLVAEMFANNLTAASKFVDKSYVIPAPVSDPKGFANALRKIVRDEDVAYIIPTCEETFHVAKHRLNYEQYCQVFCPDLEQLRQLHHKFLFNQLLLELGLPAPASYLIENKAELENALAVLGSFVLKPAYSRFADKVIINDRAVLDGATFDALELSAAQPWVAQQFISGAHFGSFSIAIDGKLTAHAVYPLQHRVGNGAATYFESTPIPAIEAIVAKLVEKGHYTGFLSFDFIQSEADGAYYAIECNPRLTSGIHLFDAFDRLWDCSLGPAYPRPENTVMLSLATLLYSLPAKTNWSDALDLLTQFFSSKDAVFSVQDMKPFLAQFSALFYFWKKTQRHQISMLAATTYDIEWNGD